MTALQTGASLLGYEYTNLLVMKSVMASGQFYSVYMRAFNTLPLLNCCTSLEYSMSSLYYKKSCYRSVVAVAKACYALIGGVTQRGIAHMPNLDPPTITDTSGVTARRHRSL